MFKPKVSLLEILKLLQNHRFSRYKNHRKACLQNFRLVMAQLNCLATQTESCLDVSDIDTRGIILSFSRQQTAKVIAALHKCLHENIFFYDEA